MKIFLKKAFTIWTFFWFLVVFLILYPLFWFYTKKEDRYHKAHNLYKIWGIWVFRLTRVPYTIEYRGGVPDLNKSYIFTPNHTSLLDIPIVYIGMINQFSFLGKSSLGKIPMFGPLYQTLHILVDRKNPRSRSESYQRCLDKIDQGKSLVLFPEGTIPTHTPRMSEFKDGAFRMAIEKQIPVIPVTIPYNWIILPDNKELGLIVNWHPAKMIFHEPIETTGMTMADLNTLKHNVHHIISAELKKHNKHEH